MFLLSPKRSVRRKRKHAHHLDRWDSSDPERAPPPLPLNPGSATPKTSPTKPNAAPSVQAAAQALIDRARENLASPYTVNPLPDRSPDRSPTRTPQHKRLQSLQTINAKDFKGHNGLAIEKADSRPSTPTPSRELQLASPDQNSVKSGTPTPTKDSKNDKESQNKRPPPRPLVRENTPPSATMLALKNMQVPDVDTPLADITNLSSHQTPHDFERIHTQMKDLTTIANALQKEMSALSKRSRDNASDLMALKKAANTRDEDIKKSLQELVSTGKKGAEQGLLLPPRLDSSRPSSSLGLHHHVPDPKPFYLQSLQKAASMPRIPTMNDIESNAGSTRAPSPSPFSMESPSSMAMLEKIIREMVTKDGQDQLHSSLSDLIKNSDKESSELLKKVMDTVQAIKDSSTSQALIRHRGNSRHSSGVSRVTSIDDGSDTAARALTRREQIPSSVTAPPAPQSAVINDELLGLLKKIKDSVSQSGGMTGEIKSLVRELRGEVLGMGRELGRKVDEIEMPQTTTTTKDDADPMTSSEIARVVQEGLDELKDSMHSVIQTRRRESFGSMASRNTVDNNEVYTVVKHALAEQQHDQSRGLQPVGSNDRESILNAVKEAFETYKPEIELQQFGLERDEILQCLKEGLEDYQASREEHGQEQSSAISRDEVIGAIQEAMQDFHPPQPPSEIAEIKQEVMSAVHECLDGFRPGSSSSKATDANRDEVLDAVREGIGAIRKEEARQIEISPDDLLQAVQAGFESMDNPFGAYGSQVLNSLHEIVEGMRVEFKQYSEANGRDTEQVLDALKDGLESLRAEIETYVDRAQDVTGKDEIIETLRTELDALRSSFDSFALHKDQNEKSGDQSDLAIWLKGEFENLQEMIVSNAQPTESSEDRRRLIEVVDSGFSELRSNLGSRGADDPSEEHLEAMKEEFEQLKEATLHGSANHKDEIIESMQESFSNIHVRLSTMSGGVDGNEDLMRMIREEMGSIRDSMQAPVLHSGNTNNDNEETINVIKESMESIRVQLAADQNESSSETLGAIREELENLREAINGSLMLGSSGTDKDMIMEAVRSGLTDVNLDAPREHCEDRNTEAFESIKEEIEQLRMSIGSALVQSGSPSSNAELLDVLKSGLDDLKSGLGSQVAYPAQTSGLNNETLDNLHESLNSLRSDISRMNDKPVDMTVSYEILDTLKEGLSHVREDLDRVKSGQGDRDVVLAESAGERQASDSARDASLDTPSRADIDRLEVMLAQLQIKIEALDQNIGAQPAAEANPNLTVKEDLFGIESTIKEVQCSLSNLAAKESASPQTQASTRASKEDVDALETLLQNTKAKIDEKLVPGIENIITRENLDTVEAVVRMTQEAVESISSRLDGEHSAKSDIEALALLVHDTSTAVNEIKEKLDSTEKEDKVSKSDVDILRDVCDDIKVKLDEVPDGLPSQSDIEELNEMLTELRDSQQALKQKYESDVGVTAKAFDDRKDESNRILESVEDLRESIEETRDHLKSRIKRGNEDVRVLDEILQGIEEKIDDIPNSVPDLDELKEAVSGEFEKANTAIESIRNDHESRCATILEKAEEHRIGVIAEMVSKLDQCFGEIKQRHDEQQQVISEATLTMTEKQKQQDDLLGDSKTMAEELKVTIDTLGSSVHGISPALQEATDKWSGDAQTVFSKVDEMSSKIEETNVDSKTNHQFTRDEVTKTLAAIGGVQDAISMNHPQVMEALSTLKNVVEQHFEHVKSSNETSEKLTDGLKAHFDEGLKRLPAPQIEAPQAETITTIDEKVHSKLDEILHKGLSSQYDDSTVRRKLDELIEHSVRPVNVDINTPRLDELQSQMTSTASEISAFIAFQTKMITAEHDNKEKEADQAALDLSKCLNEKESLESEIASLKDHKSSLAGDVAVLKAERDDLSKQKLHLTADVSSLETALKLRREELTMMDSRADALERRIIEGVMDHSRALLLAKQPRSAGMAGMNLKRVSSSASHATQKTDVSSTSQRTTTPAVINVATDMALKSRGVRSKTSSHGNASNNVSAANSPGGRRIASLSQMSNNVASGGRQLATGASRNASSGLGAGLKRSQSTREPKVRKSSWQPGAGSLQRIGDDKENDLSAGEESEADDGGATPIALPLNDSMTALDGASSRTTSVLRPPTEVTSVSRQSSISRSRANTTESQETGASAISRRTSSSKSRTSILTSRRASSGQRSGSQIHTTNDGDNESRRGSSSTVVTGTAMTPSEASYATSGSTGSYFTESSAESGVTATESDITASTDRRRSIGSTMYSNLGSEAPNPDDGSDSGGETETLASTVLRTHEHDDYEDDEIEAPAPLRIEAPPLNKHIQPQREPGPEGYDSGLGSDLPTAALSGAGSDYFAAGAAPSTLNGDGPAEMETLGEN